MMLVGSIFDYSISCALYNNKNIFGIFLAGYGEYPAALGLTAAGTLLIAGRSRECRRKMFLQCRCHIRHNSSLQKHGEKDNSPGGRQGAADNDT